MSRDGRSPEAEDKMLAYIYDDVDDSDIFAMGTFTSSSSETDAKNEKDIEVPDDKTTEILGENENLRETVEKLKSEKELLELRISEIYKTAKAEIARKDRRLQELNEEKNNIIFRRNKFAPKNNFNNEATKVQPSVQPEKRLANEEFPRFGAKSNTPRKNNIENKQISTDRGVLFSNTAEEISLQSNKLPNSHKVSQYDNIKDSKSEISKGKDKDNTHYENYYSSYKHDQVKSEKVAFACSDSRVRKDNARKQSIICLDSDDEISSSSPPRNPFLDIDKSSLIHEIASTLIIMDKTKIAPSRRKSLCVDVVKDSDSSVTRDPQQDKSNTRFQERQRTLPRTPSRSPPKTCLPQDIRRKFLAQDKMCSNMRKNISGSRRESAKRKGPRTPSVSPPREDLQGVATISPKSQRDGKGRSKSDSRSPRGNHCTSTLGESIRKQGLNSNLHITKSPRTLLVVNPARVCLPDVTKIRPERQREGQGHSKSDSRGPRNDHCRGRGTSEENVRNNSDPHNTISGRTHSVSPPRGGVQDVTRTRSKSQQRKGKGCSKGDSQGPRDDNCTLVEENVRKSSDLYVTPLVSPPREDLPDVTRKRSNAQQREYKGRSKSNCRGPRDNHCKSRGTSEESLRKAGLSSERYNAKSSSRSPTRATFIGDVKKRASSLSREANEEGKSSSGLNRKHPQRRNSESSQTIIGKESDRKSRSRNSSISQSTHCEFSARSRDRAQNQHYHKGPDEIDNYRSKGQLKHNKHYRYGDLNRSRSLSCERDNKGGAQRIRSSSEKNKNRRVNDKRNVRSNLKRRASVQGISRRPCRFRDDRKGGRGTSFRSRRDGAISQHYRSGYISRLKEKVFRYSIERDSSHAIINRNRNNKEQSDYSDLDDLRLHLSGGSDDSHDDTEKRKQSRNELDKHFELVKHLGANVLEMEDEELERLLAERMKLIDVENVNSQLEALSSEQNDDLTSIEEGQLTDGEASEDPKHVMSEESKSLNQPRTYREYKEQKRLENEALIQSEDVYADAPSKQFKTLFEARQHNKIIDKEKNKTSVEKPIRSYNGPPITTDYIRKNVFDRLGPFKQEGRSIVTETVIPKKLNESQDKDYNIKGINKSEFTRNEHRTLFGLDNDENAPKEIESNSAVPHAELTEEDAATKNINKKLIGFDAYKSRKKIVLDFSQDNTTLKTLDKSKEGSSSAEEHVKNIKINNVDTLTGSETNVNNEHINSTETANNVVTPEEAVIDEIKLVDFPESIPAQNTLNKVEDSVTHPLVIDDSMENKNGVTLEEAAIGEIKLVDFPERIPAQNTLNKVEDSLTHPLVINDSIENKNVVTLEEAAIGEIKSVDFPERIPAQNTLNKVEDSVTHTLVINDSMENKNVVTLEEDVIDEIKSVNSPEHLPAENTLNKVEDSVTHPLVIDEEFIHNDCQNNTSCVLAERENNDSNNACKDGGSFLHDFSMSEDEDTIGRPSHPMNTKADYEITAPCKTENKINILDIIIVKPSSVSNIPNVIHTFGPQLEKKACDLEKVEETLESIEQIQEAVQSINVNIEKSGHPSYYDQYRAEEKLATEELQKCLEDDNNQYRAEEKLATEELQKCLENDNNQYRAEEKVAAEELQKCLEDDNQYRAEEKLATEQLQKYLEADTSESSLKIYQDNNLIENINVSRTEEYVQNEPINCEHQIDQRNNASQGIKHDRRTVDEQMMFLFGDITPSPCKSSMPVASKVSKPNAQQVEKVKRNLLAEPRINRPEDVMKTKSSKRERKPKKKGKDKEGNSNDISREDQSSSFSSEEPKQSNIPTYPQFANNPTYIPNPRDKEAFASSRQYISKKIIEYVQTQIREGNKLDAKLQTNTKEDTSVLKSEGVKIKQDNKKVEKAKQKNAKRKQSKKARIKIKMFSNLGKKRKESDDLNESKQQKEKKKKSLEYSFSSESEIPSDNDTNSESSYFTSEDEINNSKRRKNKKQTKVSKGSKNKEKVVLERINDLVENKCKEIGVADKQKIKPKRNKSQPKKCETHQETLKDNNTPHQGTENNEQQAEENPLIETETDLRRELRVRKHVEYYPHKLTGHKDNSAPSNEVTSNTKSPRRITPLKVGEVSPSKKEHYQNERMDSVASSKRKLDDSNEESRPEKLQKLEDTAETGIKCNQSPLPHMEKMLKHLVRKSHDSIEDPSIIDVANSDGFACTHFYAPPCIAHNNNSATEIVVGPNRQEQSFNDSLHQIHFDTKDVSFLGDAARKIYDNLTIYLSDKSLPSLGSGDNKVTSNKDGSAGPPVKEPLSQLDFSNCLKKDVNTSTPIKKPSLKSSGNQVQNVNAQINDATVQVQQPMITSNISSERVSPGTTISRSYLVSPLKRDRRKRVGLIKIDIA